ncbi:TIGR03620 family F420-dependent LLM class oxidoreductase [Rhizorhabdus argentea]|uniref:TIGR03620 family F420-dependent LLM class oxidoreductase n=1 Tax=Rhizorhabdus argentea TaxID=1387174 RepID=UPI0030EC58A6
MNLGNLAVWSHIDGPISFFEDEKSGELGPATAERLARFARRVEELGYSAIWMPDGFGRDPLIASAWLLANTTKLNVATGIVSIYSRDPIAMRAGGDALNEQWGGRFILGLGVSHREAVEGMRGHRYEKPLPAMRSYLEAMARAPYNAARPAEPTRIVLAGLRQKMIALSGELAQGTHSYLVTAEHTAQARAILGPDRLLCVEQPLVLESDPAKARAIARRELEFYLTMLNYQNSWKALGFTDEDLANGGSDHFVDSVVGWGDEAALRKRIDEHLSAGATQVCIKSLAPGGGTDMRIIELLAPGA